MTGQRVLRPTLPQRGLEDRLGIREQTMVFRYQAMRATGSLKLQIVLGGLGTRKRIASDQPQKSSSSSDS